MHVLFIFGVLKQFLSNISLFFLNKFLLQSLFSIFGPHPLLKVWSPSICVHSSGRATSILFGKQTTTGTILDCSLVCQSFEEHLRCFHLTIRWFIEITSCRILTLGSIIIWIPGLVDQLVHVLIPELVCELQLIIEDLRMVDSKATILTPHAHDFIYQVKFVL